MKHFATLFVAVLALKYSYGMNVTVNICNGVADGIFLADLDNCSNYYVCYYGTYHGPYACPEGYNFNVNTQSCDFPDNGDCFSCPETLAMYPYDKTCTIYVMCYTGIPILRECIPPLQFNNDTGRCDLAENVNCMGNMCPPNDIENIVYLPSQTSCSEYFICYNGEPVPQFCAPGLYYDPALTACNVEEKVSCNITAQATSRKVVSYAKEPPIRANIQCPVEGAHFYPNEDDPASYFFCMNGSGVKLTCTPGLEYDTKTESCRLPKDVTK